MAKKGTQPPPALKFKRTEITLYTFAEFAYDPHTRTHHGRLPALDVHAQASTRFVCQGSLSSAASAALSELARKKGSS